MRYLLLILLLALADVFPDDGEKEGRRGNELYEQEEYGPAAEAYRAGIAALAEDASDRLRYGLHNNLGAALLKSGDAAAAGNAFSQALAEASDATDIARTSYNAGNAAYTAQELQKSLDHYRRSLLRDPNNQDAKFNYEFVKRRLQEQQQQQQQQQGDNQQQKQQEEQQQNGQGEQEQQNQDQSQQQEPQEPQDGGEQEQDGQQPKDQEQQKAQPQESQKLSEEQAERILQALQNEEEQLLRQVQRKDVRPRRVEKDW